MRAVHEWNLEHPNAALESVALYTAPDQNTPFARLAHDSIELPIPEGLTPVQAYLDHGLVIQTVLEAKCDAVWVGWGFVAEDPDFAAKCADAGLIFLGPSSESMRLAGDKIAAKRLAEANGVPVVPWSKEPVSTLEEVAQWAEKIGYPLALKAAAGGGGRGIRMVHAAGELEAAFQSSRQEALRAFGDDRVFVERCITRARHLEVQVAVGADGVGQAYGVRDCTVQRRHQKLIEESPGPLTTKERVAELERHALAFATAAGYQGVGTVEFIVDATRDAAYFMEMNTRLQVEHPVTECVYGIDLVKTMIRIARGESAPSAPAPRGAAVEVRLNAEDPEQGFAPAPGRVHRFVVPQGPGIRVDSGVERGVTISSDFDSNIAKVIAWGSTRKEAISRLARALDDTVVTIAGGATNRRLLRELLDDPAVLSGETHTRWLDDRPPNAPGQAMRSAVAIAAVLGYREEGALALSEFYAGLANGEPQRVPEAFGRDIRVSGNSIRVYCCGRNQYQAGDVLVQVALDEPGAGYVEIDGHRHRLLFEMNADQIRVELDGASYRVSRDSGGLVRSPSPALVMAHDVEVGTLVEAGARIATLEAMKLEMPLLAPKAGRVAKFVVPVGSQVGAGQPVVLLESDDVEEEGAVDMLAQSSRSDTTMSSAEAFAEGLRLMLGYDLDEARVERALQVFDDPSRRYSAQDAVGDKATMLLDAFVDIERLFATDLGKESETELTASNRTAFYAVARQPKGGNPAIRAAVLRASEHYGVTELSPGPLLRHAMARMAVARERTGPRPELRHRILNSVLRLLMRLHAEGIDFSGHDGLMSVLEELPSRSHRQWPFVADNASRVRYALFYAPPREPDVLERLANGELDALVRTPHSVSSALAAATVVRADATGTPSELRNHAAEAWVRRVYGAPTNASEVRVSELSGSAISVQLKRDGHTDVWAAFGAFSQMTELLEQARKEAIRGGALQVDLVIHPEQGVSIGDIASAFDVALKAQQMPPAVHRVCLIVVCDQRLLPHFTYARHPDGDLRERTRLRDMHPEMAERLQIWRLDEFKMTRLASHDRLAIFRAEARENSSDRRLLVIGEVRDIPVGDVLGAASTELLGFEHAFVEAMQGLRAVLSEEDPKGRLFHNQVILNVQPIVSVDTRAVQEVASRLAAHTHGLGLERVVARLRLRRGDGPIEPVELHFTNPTGHQMRLSVVTPDTQPIPAATPYELTARKARKRAVNYPYEVIRMLTEVRANDAVEHEFPPGRFTEYDLDAAGKAVPTDRAPGTNPTGVVFGVIQHHTAKYPMTAGAGGLERVILMSDPLQRMGALSQGECERIIGAIDLAAERQLPLEWLATSAGALISMDSGTENLDWTAKVLRKIIEFTNGSGTIHVLVDGVSVGAQSYFNAEATMLMHTKGALIMTPRGSMVLTGKRALDASGAVSAEDEVGIGGFERIMGPNGQAQYFATDIADAFHVLLDVYRYSYVRPGASGVCVGETSDPRDRDITLEPYEGDAFDHIGDIFDPAINAERKRPFAIRSLMDAVRDHDGGMLERWQHLRHGNTSVIWDTQLGGHAVTMIGIESQPVDRAGWVPTDGPTSWSGGTLFPQSSKKVARAINSASGVKPVVVLANLSGFDGSPESMRRLQLEYGAEIGRAVVNFEGPLIFCVVGRYHGGAYVVFSKALNPNLIAFAVEGSHASVIGGAPAAAVVFARDVRSRTERDQRVIAARQALNSAKLEERPALAEELATIRASVHAERQAEVAKEFDSVHSVDRARRVGSLDEVISAKQLRPRLIQALEERRS
jgi:acetyl/propionyl-CoA carboxylase alpha subunit/acetyl-CoA carboxylase carboxyltransferase component